MQSSTSKAPKPRQPPLNEKFPVVTHRAVANVAQAPARETAARTGALNTHETINVQSNGLRRDCYILGTGHENLLRASLQRLWKKKQPPFLNLSPCFPEQWSNLESPSLRRAEMGQPGDLTESATRSYPAMTCHKQSPEYRNPKHARRSDIFLGLSSIVLIAVALLLKLL
jgi:hypothetical protein